MSKPIPDIIESWINKISISQKANNLVTVDNLSTFETCDTWWAVQCGFVIINGIEYEIKSVVYDTSITVKGTPIVIGEFTFGLKVPFFIHGTPTKANQEREIKRRKIMVTPMVYLFEPIREDFNIETDSIERSTSVRMAMLHNYSEKQFTDEIYDLSIKAMRKLSERFIYTVKKQIKEVDPQTMTYNFISYAKYSTVINNNNSKTNLFNENLSGVEINLTLDLKRLNNCCTFT